jgi:hypothetical protein
MNRFLFSMEKNYLLLWVTYYLWLLYTRQMHLWSSYQMQYTKIISVVYLVSFFLLLSSTKKVIECMYKDECVFWCFWNKEEFFLDKIIKTCSFDDLLLVSRAFNWLYLYKIFVPWYPILHNINIKHMKFLKFTLLCMPYRT